MTGFSDQFFGYYYLETGWFAYIYLQVFKKISRLFRKFYQQTNDIKRDIVLKGLIENAQS